MAVKVISATGKLRGITLKIQHILHTALIIMMESRAGATVSGERSFHSTVLCSVNDGDCIAGKS